MHLFAALACLFLFIPRPAWEAIERSWTAREKNLYGRFDLRFDGHGPPQLLEYNADTPTALFEAAVVQWEWLEALKPGSDQFNSIHEKLIQAWQQFGFGSTLVYFSAVKGNAEDGGTVEYLRDTAIQAALAGARKLWHDFHQSTGVRIQDDYGGWRALRTFGA